MACCICCPYFFVYALVTGSTAARRRPTVDRRLRINYQIRVPQVRLIDEDGTQVGIQSIQEALRLAQERGRDLVEIAPQANPPVCKILDFSKYRYEEEKKAKEARKKQKGGHLKEVRIRPRIGEHDLDVKLKHAREFLGENNKVQVTVVFMGREMQHRDLGFALLEKVKIQLADVSEAENRPSMLGNRLILSLVPKRAVKETAKETVSKPPQQ